MGFQHGLSGLSTASTSLDVIGNNIANANTTGFKMSQAQFTDIYANALGAGGSSANQVGIGSKVAEISQRFTQGNISGSSNPLDIAINGTGFFRMNNGGEITYSRNGQFHVDNNGFIVNSNNLNLTGYLTDATGSIVPTEPSNLRLSTSDISPSATTSAAAGLNLDSRTVVPAVVPVFDATDPSTYASSTSATVFDTLGNSHVFTMFFQKTASGAWSTFGTIDGATAAGGVPVGVTLGGGASQALTFDTNGLLTAPVGSIAVSVDLNAVATNLGTVNDATTPFNFDLDLSTATQFGANFGVNSLSQNGFTSGRLAGFDVADDGVISGNFTNGESRTLGQIVLANFSNPQGLIPLGDSQWAQTSAAGEPLVGAPRSGPLGVLESSSVEESNVDLTTELVNMITAQRVYQANAKTIETQDAILQTLVNL